MDVTADYILKPTFECLLTVIEKGICVCVMCVVKERGNGKKKRDLGCRSVERSIKNG